MAQHDEVRPQPVSPTPHPEPPTDLNQRQLPIRDFAKDARWVRIAKDCRSPITFNSTTVGRFNAPQREFAVLYVAVDLYGAFIETFGQSTGTNIVTISALEARRFVTITATRALRFVDLTSAGLAHLGADARLTTGDHGLSQRWSRALWSHPIMADGILYRARHGPARLCLALFEDRTASNLSVTKSESPLAQSGPLGAVLDYYRFGLIP